MNKIIALLISTSMLVVFTLTACKKTPAASTESAAQASSATESASTEFERGPHNGRLLRDGDFAVEISIFEQGVAPEFRIYVTQHSKPIAAAETKLSVQLQRFGGVVDTHNFSARDDYLVSNAEVYEPHSFVVAVSAEYQGLTHRWSYSSFEGRTVINAAMAAANGIETARAGAGIIKESIALYGSIQPDATRMRSVVARFPGVIRSVDATVGTQVRVGQLLARIESNESLQTYAVTAPIAGTVLKRFANPGETSGSEPLFEIGDYSQLWAVLNIFPRDRARLHSGQAIIVRASDGSATSTGTIDAISNGATTITTTTTTTTSALNARMVLDNRNQQWAPGLFIEAEVIVAENQLPVVVPISALQAFRDWQVVFINNGDTYQAQPVQLGRRDRSNVEITAGLSAGATFVVRNSYLIKADIEKAGASHDH
jgi:cobalt-zinc-cadmium efflux system membrane fusion protein